MRKNLHYTVHNGCGKFFRFRLLTSSPDEIGLLINKQDKQIEQIKNDLIQMCWYMRGGIQYNDLAQMSFQEREIISAIIKEHMETTEKTGLPFY